MILHGFGLLLRHAVTAFVVWLAMALAFFISLILMPFFGLFGMVLPVLAYAFVAEFWFSRVHGRDGPGERGARVLYICWSLVKIKLILAIPFFLIMPIAFGKLFFVPPHMMGDETIGMFMMNIMHVGFWVVLLLPLWLWLYLRWSLVIPATALDGPMKLRDSWRATRGRGFSLALMALALTAVLVLVMLTMMLGGPFLGFAAYALVALAFNSALYLEVNGSEGQRG